MDRVPGGMARAGKWLVAAVVVLASGIAGGTDLPRYAKPAAATKGLRAVRQQLPVALWHGPDKWTIGPQQSRFPLRASVARKDAPVSGAFVYRAGRARPTRCGAAPGASATRHLPATR